MSDELVLRDSASDLLNQIATGVGNALDPAAPPELVAETHAFLSMVEKALDNNKELVRQRLIEIVTGASGKANALVLGGIKVQCTLQNSGCDATKLEVLLRSKGLEPTCAMDAKISYKVNMEKVGHCVLTGDLTQDEVNACLADVKYRVIVKPAREEQ